MLASRSHADLIPVTVPHKCRSSIRLHGRRTDTDSQLERGSGSSTGSKLTPQAWEVNGSAKRRLLGEYGGKHEDGDNLGALTNGFTLLNLESTVKNLQGDSCLSQNRIPPPPPPPPS